MTTTTGTTTNGTTTTGTTTGTREPRELDQERRDLLETLRTHRHFLRVTARGLGDEQAGMRSTVSALCVGGILKHVTQTERNWLDFALGGPGAMMHGNGDWSAEDWEAALAMSPGDRLDDVVAAYDAVARRTDDLVATLDLDATQPLPSAPWFAPGARWSARRVLLHVIAETAQHAGHADIIRESIDGQKTMG